MNSGHIIRSVLGDHLYIAQGIDDVSMQAGFRIFKLDPTIQYFPLCDDFGPMNMACVTSFILQLDRERADHPDCRLVFCVDDGRRSLTNAVFLLGAYLILSQDASVEDAEDCFSWLDADQYEEYRDATFSQPTFRLGLADCWRALHKARRLGWVGPPDADGFCGELDMQEYAHYDDPLNGDLHEVVPGKLIAFVGPQDLGGEQYRDNENGLRRFSPAFFAGLLEELGVSAVVRLNEAQYDGQAFADHGMVFIDLPFDDCTPPPPHIAQAFLDAVEAAPGLVAVHCKAGLGRTGTLIGLELMRTHGFTAREAMGWLRIMRPGSVIGEQQQYLVAAERRANGLAEAPTDSGSVDSEGMVAGGGECDEEPAAAAQLAADVWAGAERRGIERWRRSALNLDGGSGPWASWRSA